MDRDFKGFWIPKEIWESDLTTYERVLSIILFSRANEKNVVYCSKRDLHEEMGTSNKIMNRLLNSLEAKGYIHVESIDEAAEKVKSKNFEGIGIGNKECEWCNIKTFVLHEHHYPIPKAKGGTEVVNICPNCHHEYHYLEDVFIEITLDMEGFSKAGDLDA